MSCMTCVASVGSQLTAEKIPIRDASRVKTTTDSCFMSSDSPSCLALISSKYGAED